MIQKKRKKYNKGKSVINAKLGRDTTTAVSQLQWSQRTAWAMYSGTKLIGTAYK